MAELSLQGITMVFDGKKAVDSVDFSVRGNELVTLLGPSGCGKTTLLKIISGFLTPTSGRILLDGADVSKVQPEHRDTALCFQSYALFPHLTVKENLSFGLRQRRVGRAEQRERLDAAISQLELSEQLDKLPNQLSGGQQQRVALGRALVMRPSVILFDEPLSSLDARLRDQVRIEIRRIQKEAGITAVYVTHDQSEALAMSDRVFVMNGGRIVQADAPENLYNNPRTSFVASFIGGANVLSGAVIGVSEGGIWMVQTPIGKLRCIADHDPPNKNIHVAWRPERAQIGAGPLTARIIARAFQGHFTELFAEANGVQIRLLTDASTGREGENIEFSLAPEDVLFVEFS